MTPLTILGIETSCDETAAALVRGTPGTPGEILSNVVYDQLDLHKAYGGVVPEIAARAHVEKADVAVAEALRGAGATLADVDAVAVTAGPGLVGGLMAGVMTAKGLALGANKPLIGVNHLEGHALTGRLTDGIAFPYLLLLVSGGHCLLMIVDRLDSERPYERLGATIDDAPGEAFDKTAKLMGLGYPGGPAVERLAAKGDPARFPMPRMLIGRPGCNFSFSGLKTAVRMAFDGLSEPSMQDRADLCAGFQAAVVEALTRQTRQAMTAFRTHDPWIDDADVAPPVLAVAGGVAANGAIRAGLEKLCAEERFRLVPAPLFLCGDNAAMIAWAGLERFAHGARDGLDLAPRPRWPLDTTAVPVIGSGRKGAKA